MITNRLDNNIRSAIANTKSRSRDAADVGFATRCAIESNVANDHILFRNERGAFWGHHDDLSPGQTLTKVVVGIAFESQRDALWYEGAKALARRPLKA